jgi:hypothetical protein
MFSRLSNGLMVVILFDFDFLWRQTCHVTIGIPNVVEAQVTVRR